MKRKYKVLSIDAWGNQEDGYEWNSWHLLGYVEADINAGQAAIVDDLIEANILSPDSREIANAAHLDDDQYNLVFCDPQTFEPIYAIEYGSVEA